MVLAVGLGACSGSDASPAEKAKAGYAAKTKAEVQDRASQESAARGAACSGDLAALRQAIGVYEVAEQAEPTTMADLVPTYLHDAPAEYQIAAGPDGKPVITLTAAGTAASCPAPSGSASGG